MKTKKILILVLIGLSFLFLTQCATHVRYDYLIADFKMTNYAFSNPPKVYITQKINDSINVKNNYGVRIDFETRIVQTVDLRAYNLGLINTCYAISKSTQVNRLMNKMDSISIITKNDFDSLHHKNSSITDLFNILYDDYKDSIAPLRTGFKKYFSEYQDYDSGMRVGSLYIFLTKKAELDSLIQFEIKLHFLNYPTITRNTSLVRQY